MKLWDIHCLGKYQMLTPSKSYWQKPHNGLLYMWNEYMDTHMYIQLYKDNASNFNNI